MNKNNSEKGQAGIVVILVSVVLLTIGLSIANRSVTDVRFSRQEEETTRAFNAAEAGIEEALRKDLATIEPNPAETIDVDGIVTTYDVTGENVMEVELAEGETVEVNLDTLDINDHLGIWWGDPSEDCDIDSESGSAAIEVSFYNSGANSVRRLPFEASGCDREPNNFESSTNSDLVEYKSRITFAENDFMEVKSDDEDKMRIRIIYGPDPADETEGITHVLVSGVDGVTLPPQYYRINSEAQTTGGETRAVEVTRTIPGPLSIFDFAIFTTGSLAK